MVLPRVGINLGGGLVAAVFDATVGAILLLLLVGLVHGRDQAIGAGSGAFDRDV